MFQLLRLRRTRYSFTDSTLAQSQHSATTTDPSSTLQTVSPLRPARTADEWTVKDYCLVEILI